MQESKDNTARILTWFQSQGKMPVSPPRLAESGIELYADGVARNRVFGTSLPAVLKTFFTDRQPQDYLALLAYVDRSAANVAKLEAMRRTTGLVMPVITLAFIAANCSIASANSCASTVQTLVKDFG